MRHLISLIDFNPKNILFKKKCSSELTQLFQFPITPQTSAYIHAYL